MEKTCPETIRSKGHCRDDACHYNKRGGHLDQIFVKNVKLMESTLSEDFIDDISDHKCFKVNLKLQERTPAVQMRNMNNSR
jgi:hypothetical protein